MIVYGCAAHYLNLVDNAFNSGEVAQIKSHIVEVQKYFRNHQKPAGLLKENGGVIPQIPNDTRWLSDRACYKTFVQNHHIYQKVRGMSSISLPKNMTKLIDNGALLHGAKHMLEVLDKVAIALNTLQGNTPGFCETVSTWQELMNDETLPKNLQEEVKRRYNESVTEYHVLAYMVGKSEDQPDLPDEEYEKARLFLEEISPSMLKTLVDYMTRDESVFPKSLLASKMKECDRVKYWRFVTQVMRSRSSDATKFCELMIKINACPPSSAGLERIFSSFGLVHTKLRNRLGNERVSKLVKVYAAIRDSNSSSSSDNLDIIEELHNSEGGTDIIELS